MNDHQDRLNAKVKAVNRAHRLANGLFPKLRDALAPFVGQQVVKADGDLMKKVKDALPDFPKDAHVYRSQSNYTLGWTVKTDDCTPQGLAQYYEIGVYVGDLEGGCLKKLYDPPAHRTDFTAQEVQQKRQAYEAAKKAADEAKSALHPFGENDR